MSALHRRNLLAGLTGLAAFCGGDAWANAPAPKTVRKPAPLPRPKLVFLDPGHGGRDPGALGLRGTQEKSVVMAIARDLQKELLAGGRYRVLLTRSTDSFVALRERVARAQAAKADLFLSLHADSNDNPDVRGASVYTLSEEATDREAAALAARENRADAMISGMKLADKDDSVARTLVAMSQRALDNFNIQMGLSLVGIGAVLRSDDGYAKIVELVPGGPADRGGKLKVNDRIAAVAQDEEEFEDVVDMKLDRVVERIRGKKGTTVRLQVLPAASPDPSKLEVITIVRDEVQLKDQQAKAQVIDTIGPDGADTRIGWITLPSFYANMNQRGQPARSTTKDVSALLKRLKKENIEGLIIDLRRDSGGSLDEAIRLTGLFIPKGPVVQAKDTDGNINPMTDSDPSVLWEGPLIVLMNRLSASASEIFAAALQDYGRGIVVGDEQSFGKGTVQTLIDVQRFMPFFAQARDAGAVKLTIQKFYRIKGGSTQLRGVASDIVLPSLTDQDDVGEGSLENPLGYDEVPARQFTPAGNVAAIVPRLRTTSESRVAANAEFDYIREDYDRLVTRIEENAVSLNKKTRLAEIEEEKTRREARLAERKERGAPGVFAREVTLDTVESPELQKVSLDKPPKQSYTEPEDVEDPSAPDEEEPFVDPVRDEALLIMQDYIKLLGPEPVTARAAAEDTAATP